MKDPGEALDRLVHALAAPALDPSEVRDRESAQATIAALFSATDGPATLRVLAWFASAGHRQEWVWFEYYVARKLLKIDPRDLSRARKAGLAASYQKRLGKRGLIALDTMRACALATWAATAGWLTRDVANAAVWPLVTLALKEHRSWADYGEQLLLGLEFTDGAVDAELAARLGAPEGTWPTPWPTEVPAAPSGESTHRVFALALAVDCPGCGYATPAPGIVAGLGCALCGFAIGLTAEDWAYFFAEDVAALRERPTDFDPITNDFGARFFARWRTEEVAAPACACGTTLTVAGPGALHCGCGRSSVVRAADALARAIDAEATLVVEALPRPVDPAARFSCAACGAEQPLGADPARVRRCQGCQHLTYVDDATHARSFDPPRRPTSYLIVR